MNILNGKRTVAKPTGETCAELYERLNEGYGMTLRNFQERFNGKNELRFSMRREATAKEVAIMEAMYPPKKEIKRVGSTPMKAGNIPAANVSPGIPQKKKPVDWDMAVVRGMLGFGVVGHAALIWYELGYLWGGAGVIAGSVVFTLIFSAVILIRKNGAAKSSESILHVVWALDVFAAVVHDKALYHGGVNAYGAGISEYGTACLAAVISFCACALIYFYRETGLKK